MRGLVIVAKTPDTFHALQLARTQGQVHVRYTALVFGIVQNNHGTMDRKLLFKNHIQDNNQPAVVLAEWHVLQRGTYYTLLEIHALTTGHNKDEQGISRYLSHCLGHAIVGDNNNNNHTYNHGGGPKNQQELSSQELFLCANAVSFRHPITRQTVKVSLPSLPEEYYKLLMSTVDPLETSSYRHENSKTIADWVQEARRDLGAVMQATQEGVECTGEPAIDPSRMINANQGDSEWVDDW